MTRTETELMLAGKVVIVTGAGRGLGRAMALAFAEAGASVVVNDTGGTYEGKNRNASVASEVAETIRKGGGRAVDVAASVADPAGAEAIFQAATDEFGQVDGLVNNAGISRQNMVWDMPVEDFDAVIATHLRGTFLCTKAVARHMIERGSGSIINVGSGVFASGAVANCSYPAAKAGVVGLTYSLALDLGPLGLRVNCICPAGHTRLFDKPEPWRDVYQTQPRPAMPADRWPPEAIPPLLTYLLSDKASDVNGQVFSCGANSLGWYEPASIKRETLAQGSAMFTASQAAEAVPAVLLDGVPNPSPYQPEDGRTWLWTRQGGLPAAHDPRQRPGPS